MGTRNGRTTKAVDKATLLARRLGHDEVTLDDGSVVVVRGLSRTEVVQDLHSMGPEARADGAFERRMLALGMIDPELTEDEVGMWQENSIAGEIEEVTNVIMRLSGLAPGDEKAAYKSIPEQPDA